MQLRVFVSYAHKDKTAVDDLRRTLRLLGVDPVDDTSLAVSDNIEKRIKAFIEKEVTAVLVAISNNALASDWVRKEIRFAKEAKEMGFPVRLCFALVESHTDLPKEIADELYFDASRPGTVAYYESLFSFVRFLLNRLRPYEALGVYDVFESRLALNARREGADGRPGCDLARFLSSARKQVVGVGLWFATLFHNDSGKALDDLLRRKAEEGIPVPEIDLYVPDWESAPLENLALTHYARDDAAMKIKRFVREFKRWGRRQQNRSNLRLHLLRFVPAHVMLCIDPYEPYGRIIVDNLVTGMGGEHQLKVELRHLQTPLYSLYLDSLRIIQENENTVRVIYF